MVFAGYSLSFFFTAYEQKSGKIKALICTLLVELLIWLLAMGIYHLSLIAKCHAKKVIRHDIRLAASEKIHSMSYSEQQAKDCGNFVSWLTNDVDQVYTQAFAPVISGIEANLLGRDDLGVILITHRLRKEIEPLFSGIYTVGANA